MIRRPITKVDSQRGQTYLCVRPIGPVDPLLKALGRGSASVAIRLGHFLYWLILTERYKAISPVFGQLLLHLTYPYSIFRLDAVLNDHFRDATKMIELDFPPPISRYLKKLDFNFGLHIMQRHA